MFLVADKHVYKEPVRTSFTLSPNVDVSFIELSLSILHFQAEYRGKFHSSEFFSKLCDRNFCFISQPVSNLLFGLIFTSVLLFVVFRNNMYVNILTNRLNSMILLNFDRISISFQFTGYLHVLQS